jgi:hypothetical protein
MVRGTVSMVSSYKATPDARMVIEINEPEKQNAMLLDKRDVVIMGAEEFVKLAEAIPNEILSKLAMQKIEPKTEGDDFGK